MSKEDVEKQEEKKKKDLGRIRRRKRRREIVGGRELPPHQGREFKTLPLTIAKVFPSTQKGLMFQTA